MASAEQPFLFMFGFESPSEHFSNENNGTDFESSWALWISADNADAALAWGRCVAEEFVCRLFEQAGDGSRSWTEDGFAHWISEDTSEQERARGEASIQTVADGQMPDLSWALKHWGR